MTHADCSLRYSRPRSKSRPVPRYPPLMPTRSSDAPKVATRASRVGVDSSRSCPIAGENVRAAAWLLVSTGHADGTRADDEEPVSGIRPPLIRKEELVV